MAKYKVKVLRDLCIGAASCVAVSPKVFQLDQEAKAVVTDQDGDIPENILSAAESCPVNAIIIEDENGNQVWPK
ncbi:ferredoxin [Candidatus Gottesmanbacteria bacterium]|nr:ferredoxin [Candidatus Gottesmanbacteria bacterium]